MSFLERGWEKGEKGLLAISLRFAAARQPFGLALTAFVSSHNLSLRTSCMSQIMPHPRPQGVEYPTHTNT